MAFSPRHRFRFQSPANRPADTVADFPGMDTRGEVTDVAVRLMQNARPAEGSGFRLRPGSTRVGEVVSASEEPTGLFSYRTAAGPVCLVQGVGTELYRQTDSGAPATVASSTSARATGYGKDRHAFLTSALDGAGRPYLVVTYQSGSGIVLESAAYPYTSWAGTPVTVDSSVQSGWSCQIDADDNLHVAFMSDANVTRYVKLAYGAGPAWTVGTKYAVAGSGASDRAVNPTVVRQDSGRLHVAYAAYDGGAYVNKVKLSEDGGATWSAAVTLGTPGSALTYAVAGAPAGGEAYFVIQEDAGGTGTAYGYNKFVYNGSYVYQGYLGYAGTQTLGEFSVVPAGTGVSLHWSPGANADGVAAVSLGGMASSDLRAYEVAQDSGSDSDVRYRTVSGGVASADAVRVTDNSDRNRYPSVPPSVPSSSAFVPVLFQTGTGSPYSVKVNAASQWSALSANLTSDAPLSAANFPVTGTGGTDDVYFVNGTDAVKWDGSSVTAATSTGFPAATWVTAYDQRLWLFAGFAAWYTDLGADNFSGAFPPNYVTFPEAVLGGIVLGRQLLVFGESRVYRIQNFDYTGETSAGQVEPIPSSYGTLSMRTVQVVGSWAYFQSPDGQVRRTNGQYVDRTPVSDDVSPDCAALSRPLLRRACAGVSGDTYYLSAARSGSGDPDLTFAFDTVRAPKGTSVDTGKWPGCYCVHPASDGSPVPYFQDARSSKAAAYRAEGGGTDDGAPIGLDVRTGARTLGSLFYDKHLHDILAVAEATGAEGVTLSYSELSTLDSFRPFPLDLSSGASVWGVGAWGDGRTWGGASYAEHRKAVDAEGRAFQLRVSGSVSDAEVAVLALSLTHTPLRGEP